MSISKLSVSFIICSLSSAVLNETTVKQVDELSYKPSGLDNIVTRTPPLSGIAPAAYLPSMFDWNDAAK